MIHFYLICGLLIQINELMVELKTGILNLKKMSNPRNYTIY